MKNFLNSTHRRIGAMLLISALVGIAAYFVDHLIVQSTLADYTDHKLIIGCLWFAATAVFLHFFVPDV